MAIIFTTAHRVRPDHYVVASPTPTPSPPLGGTTALLLLGVFTIVNIAVLVLRRDPSTTTTS